MSIGRWTRQASSSNRLASHAIQLVLIAGPQLTEEHSDETRLSSCSQKRNLLDHTLLRKISFEIVMFICSFGSNLYFLLIIQLIYNVDIWEIGDIT